MCSRWPSRSAPRGKDEIGEISCKRESCWSCERMRLEGIESGDIVEVDHNGRRFFAIVTAPAPGGLALAPVDRRVNYHSCRSREVIGHWAKRGRPRQSSEPLQPSPRQLEIDLTSGLDPPRARPRA
jgi:hypothetical protein